MGGGAQEVVRGGTAPSFPRSDGTDCTTECDLKNVERALKNKNDWSSLKNVFAYCFRS